VTLKKLYPDDRIGNRFVVNQRNLSPLGRRTQVRSHPISISSFNDESLATASH